MPDANTPDANNGQPGGNASDQPQYVTKEEIAAIVNSAVTSQLKRSLGKELGGAIEAALAPVREQLTTLAKPPEVIAPKAGAEQKPEQKNEQQPDPRVAELEKKLALLVTENTAARTAAARERKASLDARANSDLQKALTGKVRPEAVSAIADLMRARGMLIVDDEGNAKLKIRASLERGLPEEDHELPIDAALPHYLKTPEAALFIPPPQRAASGSGRLLHDSQGGRGPTSTTSALDAFADRHGKTVDELL